MRNFMSLISCSETFFTNGDLFMKANKIKALKGIDGLFAECFSYCEANADIEITAQGNSISNIKKSRLLSIPHAIYGHKYRPNQVVGWKLKKNLPADVYATDNQGILKNAILGENAEQRIKNAIRDGSSVFAFFGGSTMMSMGSVTPDFSIPALVERILMEKYDKKVVCVNFGLGGTCCKEAFQLYLNEIKLKNVGAHIIFYDGWNCASYLTQKRIMSYQLSEEASGLVTEADAMMSIAHNIRLGKAYDFKWHLKTTFNLFFAHLTNYIQNLMPKFIGSQLLRIQGRLFPLDLIQREKSQLLNASSISDEILNNISERAVDEYVELHKLIKNLVLPHTGYLWIQQPLVFWGNKSLTQNEKEWNENGYSSGDPKIFRAFNDALKMKISGAPDVFSNFVDMTNVFDEISEELYIDSGHLNRLGNLVVSASIASEIMSKHKEFTL